MALLYNRGDLRVFVENRVILAGVDGLTACGTKGKSFLGIRGFYLL